MTRFLLKWTPPNGQQNGGEEGFDDETAALTRIGVLALSGCDFALYERNQVKLSTKAIIVRRERKSSAPEEAVPAEPPPAPAPLAADSVCASPDCDDPAAAGGAFCATHHIGGVSPETAEKLRKGKGQPRAAPPVVPHG